MRKLTRLAVVALLTLPCVAAAQSHAPLPRQGQAKKSTLPAQHALENFPPECDALIRPLSDHEVDYKLVDAFARAAETGDWPTIHKLLPDVTRRVYKGDDIGACANAAVVRHSYEGAVVALSTLLYNDRWSQGVIAIQDQERKAIVDKFNELAQKYNKALILLSAPPTYVSVPPVTCTTMSLGGGIVTTTCH